MRTWTAVVSACAMLGCGLPAQSVVIFEFNYTDQNVGFNDPTLGAARRAALESAGGYLSSFLTGYDASIQLDVNGSVTDDDSLAAAGSNYNAPAVTGFGNRGDVMLKILGGNAADPSAAADGTVSWNFEDFQWELGDDFQPGEYDFFSTAVHELLHALDFSSSIGQLGQDPVPGDPTGNWSPFDDFVADGAGDLINDTTFALDLARWSAASLAGGACGTGLLFTGPLATVANGGNPVELFSPAQWSDGSSGSHLDDACYSGRYMMEAATAPGLGRRTLSTVETAILRDIGYTRLAVPTTPPDQTAVQALQVIVPMLLE